MLTRSLLIFLLASITACAPVEGENAKRSFEGVLGSLSGLLGFDAIYDYVIIGGGTAGLVMAERLSEDPSLQVAVIEAGSYYEITNPIVGMTPSGDTLFVGADPSDTNPLVDWNFVTSPQSGANGRSIHYASGKTLGGSSARNFMIYQRGTSQSYQQWADLVDDQSYTFDNLLPFFKKGVHFTPPNTSKRFANATTNYNPAAFDPAGGPLQVSYTNYVQPFSTWMRPALNEIGVAEIQDFNSGSLLGSQYSTSTIDPSNESRDSSQASFLNLAAGRSNLKVYDLTLAKKIIFDSSKTATGVTVASDGHEISYTINARKEVILSAGAFHSPQMLMVSGVGPKEILDQFSIPIIANRLGVGNGMQDHVFFGPSYRVNVQTLTRAANDPSYIASETFGEYSTDQAGPLTNPVCDFLGWEKLPRDGLSSNAQTALAQFPADWPEMEYISAAGYVGNFSNLLSQPNDGYQYATILGGLVAPLSRGTVTITSADTQDLPVINPNWVTDPTDKEVAVAIYKRTRQAFASSAMQGVLVDPVEYFPGPEVQTDEEIMEVIRDTVQTIWHASCTCRMGKSTDPMAVVDSNAKVIGVDKLRVVDASAFALLVPGHPQSTVYALAEKIAAQIMAGN